MAKLPAGKSVLPGRRTFERLKRAGDQIALSQVDEALVFGDGRRVEDNTVVPIKNNSGADRAAYDVLGIDSFLVTPANNLREVKANYAVVGVLPTSDHADSFAILQEPIPAGRIGNAVIAGNTLARLDASGTAAAAADGNATNLVAGSGGSKVLVAAQDAGSQWWGLVRLGNGGSLPRYCNWLLEDDQLPSGGAGRLEFKPTGWGVLVERNVGDPTILDVLVGGDYRIGYQLRVESFVVTAGVVDVGLNINNFASPGLGFHCELRTAPPTPRHYNLHVSSSARMWKSPGVALAPGDQIFLQVSGPSSGWEVSEGWVELELVSLT